MHALALLGIKQRTKFEMPGFTHFKKIIWSQHFLNADPVFGDPFGDDPI